MVACPVGVQVLLLLMLAGRSVLLGEARFDLCYCLHHLQLQPPTACASPYLLCALQAGLGGPLGGTGAAPRLLLARALEVSEPQLHALAKLSGSLSVHHDFIGVRCLVVLEVWKGAHLLFCA